MGKVPKAQTGRNAVTVEVGRRALDAATTPREIRDIEKMAELATKWAKHQGYALDQQIAWGKLRFDALRKLGQILPPLLTRHRPRKSVEGHDTFRLKDAGISRDLSLLAQAVAAVSVTVYERYFADAERERREITQKDFLEKVDAVKKSQHFTSRGEAKRLYELTQRKIAEYGIKYDCWLEPCAGNGAFYRQLPVDRRLGIDIDPQYPGIVEADFLTFDGFTPGVTYAAIGNFPWGENGVVKFFNRYADHCSMIASLVPLSFLRPHAINQLDRRFHLLHEEVSPRGQPPIFATVFQIWARGDKIRDLIETLHDHLDFEFLARDRPDLREAADIVMRRIGVNAGKILNPSDVPRPDTAHWIKCRPGVDVEKVRARFRAIDWRDPKCLDAAEAYGARGYASLSMSAVVDEYERMQALTNLLHQHSEKFVELLVADDPEKAAEIWRLLGEQLGLSNQRKKQDWYMPIENQVQPDEPEARYNLPIIDKARGWDTWHGKLTWLDGLSFEDKLREAPRCSATLTTGSIKSRASHPPGRSASHQYNNPYFSFGGSVRICGSPQTVRFIANVQVPLRLRSRRPSSGDVRPQNRALGHHIMSPYGAEHGRIGPGFDA
jgi:hypothetical protein